MTLYILLSLMTFAASSSSLPLTLADLQAALWLPADVQPNPEPTPANCISERRCVSDQSVWLLLITVGQEFMLCFVFRQEIHIFLVHSWTIVSLLMRIDYCQLKCYKPSNQMLWLISSSCEALARGHKVRARGQMSLTTQQNLLEKG